MEATTKVPHKQLIPEPSDVEPWTGPRYLIKLATVQPNARGEFPGVAHLKYGRLKRQRARKQRRAWAEEDAKIAEKMVIARAYHEYERKQKKWRREEYLSVSWVCTLSRFWNFALGRNCNGMWVENT